MLLNYFLESQLGKERTGYKENKKRTREKKNTEEKKISQSKVITQIDRYSRPILLARVYIALRININGIYLIRYYFSFDRWFFFLSLCFMRLNLYFFFLFVLHQHCIRVSIWFACIHQFGALKVDFVIAIKKGECERVRERQAKNKNCRRFMLHVISSAHKIAII